MPQRPDAPIVTASDRVAAAEGCTFDLAAAERVRTFFARFLKHSKGQWAGKPFELLDWQWERIIKPLFGWRRADGTRRFRRAHIEIPKKNGKSTLGAGLALYLLVADHEAGAEVYSAASDRDQASIVYREAEQMVASSGLRGRLDPIPSTKRIVYKKTGSFYKALSADVPTKEGLNIHGLIFDELHAQKSRELWDTLTYGGAARRQPLFIAITTAGYDRASICWEQHQYAEGILDGAIIDIAFFPFLAAAGQEDDWTAPATWKKANPSFGVTIAAEDMAEACKEAQNSPAKENSFRRYRLNQWTEQETRWLGLDKWDACSAAPIVADGACCYAGLDLSSTTDLAALVLLFPPDPMDPQGCYDVLPFFWCPYDTAIARERLNRVKYRTWMQAGHIERTEGNVVDHAAIRGKINQLAERYQILQLGIDRWNAVQLAVELQGDGLHVEPFGQGYASLSGPTKRLESLILEAKLRHGGHPVLRWNFGNAALESDAAGNVKPSKKKAKEKIDGVVALIMALGLAMAGAGSPTPTITVI